MFSTIIILCTGNICRSPMAEAFFRHHAEHELSRTIDVRSAGIHALVGHPADAHAISLMADSGLDISNHRGQKLSSYLVQWAGIILVMDQGQKRSVEHDHPTARGKVFRLLEDENRDIPDPYGQDLHAFSSALEQIQRGTRQWIEKLR